MRYIERCTNYPKMRKSPLIKVVSNLASSNRALYSALQDSCPLERVNRQWLNSVMVHNTEAISLYSDIDSC